MQDHSIIVKDLGVCEYSLTYQMMRRFTADRTPDSIDEVWNLQHSPVYTLGRAGKEGFVIESGNIPVERVDRGGQVTYHGPGQLVQYLLLNLSRLGIGVRTLVSEIENSVVSVLDQWGIASEARPDAPGVYVGEAKIASLGLRVSRGYSYHGLALNVDMDMSPWAGINACGLGIPVTQIADLVESCPGMAEISDQMTQELMRRLGYNSFSSTSHSDKAIN